MGYEDLSVVTINDIQVSGLFSIYKLTAVATVNVLVWVKVINVAYYNLAVQENVSVYVASNEDFSENYWL